MTPPDYTAAYLGVAIAPPLHRVTACWVITYEGGFDAVFLREVPPFDLLEAAREGARGAPLAAAATEPWVNALLVQAIGKLCPVNKLPFYHPGDPDDRAYLLAHNLAKAAMAHS